MKEFCSVVVGVDPGVVSGEMLAYLLPLSGDEPLYAQPPTIRIDLLRFINGAHMRRNHLPALGKFHPGLHLAAHLARLVRTIGEC
jgi:hypothetical protein